MRLTQSVQGKSHKGLNGITPSDHHPPPSSVIINNTTQSLPPGTTYNLNISLPYSNYKLANIIIHGPRRMTPSWNTWFEYADIMATNVLLQARGQSVRDAGWKQVYSATYSKQNSDLMLSCKIFDNNTNISNRYIALQDAQIIGSILRLTFKNFFGGSATLWVKGQVVLQ